MNAHASVPPRPAFQPFEGLPALQAIDTLRQHRQWVTWTYQWKESSGKWDKPPINPHTDRNGSHSDPSNWSSYETAAELATRKAYAGVGFVMAPDDGMTGFDLDDCRDPGSGALTPIAAKVVALAETYAEVSPSGCGIRLFGLGKVEKATKCDPAGVEIYGSQRYLTLTGHHVAGTPTDIRPVPRTLDVLLAHVEKVNALVAAQSERIASAAKARAAPFEQHAKDAASGSQKNPFWRAVNTAAFANLSAWVPVLFGSDAKFQPGTGGYRVTSRALGRDLEEDLSFTEKGCVDFGVADQGDARGGGRSAIDLVVQFNAAPDPTAAAMWLCQQLFIEPASIGWQEQPAKKAEGSAAPATWPEPKPLPSGLSAVEAFKPAMIPKNIGDWVSDIADRMQCPPDFVAVSAMVALSAALGRKVAIRPQEKTDWSEVPNLWGCIVGRPGAMKSPAMAEAMKPLTRLEANARKGNDEAMVKHKKLAEVARLKKEQAQKDFKAAIKRGDDPGDIDLDVNEPEAPIARRYITVDCTYESLGAILAANPNGVLGFRDELVSLLKNLDREENASARGFYLSAWNGTSGYTFDRIVRGITHIDAACVSMLGSTQPGRLADYIGRAVQGGAGDDGLIQRFGLLVWPDDSGDWREVDRYPLTEPRERAWDTFTRMDVLTPDSVGALQGEYDKIPFLRLDNQAQGLFREWRADLEHRLAGNEMHGALKSHLSKYRKLVPSLSLINHLADGGDGPVSEVAVARAIDFSIYLESHARRAYGSGLQSEVDTASAILGRIRKRDLTGEFTARDIQRKEWSNLSDKDQIAGGLDLLDDLGWVRSKKVDTGGRPKILFSINPRGLQ